MTKIHLSQTSNYDFKCLESKSLLWSIAKEQDSCWFSVASLRL